MIKGLLACVLLPAVAVSARPGDLQTSATDDFGRRNGGADIPGWETDSVSWRVRDGQLRFDGRDDRSFARPADLASGLDAAAEVTVTVGRRAIDGWGVAALAVRRDDRNYWHLALVEAPTNGNCRHFVELSEMLDGQWLAQFAEPTRLSVTAREGADFNWSYGRPYRLRIGLNSNGVEGTVEEADGTVRARLGFRFDGPAVASGAPALAAAGLDTRFDDFRATVDRVVPPPPAPVFPAYDLAGDREIRSRATGFFRVEEKDGRWWIVDPNGGAFYWVGTDHIRYDGHWCEKLGYAPYGRVAREKYGNETNWAIATMERLKAWGFNTLAAGHSPSLRHRGLPHIEFLSLGATFAGRDDLCPKTTWTGFPNVFSEDWPAWCDRAARRLCAPHRDDPWLLGCFFDNELEWFGKSHRPGGLFDEAWKKPADHSAKKAWITFLSANLPSIAAFNERFGTSFDGFPALAASTNPATARDGAGLALQTNWVRRTAELYFKTCADAIRRHDPNHLLLGCRFAGDAPPVWDIAGRYCDIVTVNLYPRIDIERGVPADFAGRVAGFHRLAGRPLAVTEWSFPALDAGLPSRHGAGMRVDTQAQRTRCFEHFQEFLFRQPFVVGSSYFMYLDEPPEGISSTFPEDSNYGLVDNRDEPYPALTAAASRLNPMARALHLRGGFKPAGPPTPAAPFPWPDPAPAGSALPSTLKWQSGPVTLEGPVGGRAWRMSIGGRPLADLLPVVHQRHGIDQWVHPQTAKITGVRENERLRFVDMEFAADFPSGPPVPAPFLVRMRYAVPKSTNGWVASRCVNVANTGRQSWTLAGIYHYAIPLAGDGDLRRIEPLSDVPNYYRPVHAWADRARNIALGAWYADGAPFECLFWKGEGGSFHSDLRTPVDRDLAPGASWDGPPEPAFHFGIDGAALDAHGQALRRVTREIVLDGTKPGP